MKLKTMAYIRHFKCPICSTEITAPKLSKTGYGHVKTMYCYVCRADRDFVQIGIEKTK